MRSVSIRLARRSALGALLAAFFGAGVSITVPARAAEPGGSAKPKPAPSTSAPTAASLGFFAEIMILHATNGKKGIDARIGPMPELGKPPFSSYENYALLERTRVPLEKDPPRTLPLPNGRVLETRLVEVLGKDSLRLSARITDSNAKELLTLRGVRAKLNQSFIVAGPSYKQGILVLVIRVVR